MAVKAKREGLEIFSLSFLDIISCAFGAIVMLVLLAKNADEHPFVPVALTAELLRSISDQERNNAALQAELEAAKQALQQAQARVQQAQKKQQQAREALASVEAQTAKVTTEKQGLEAELKNAQAATQAGTETEKDQEAGGIPVDSEYVTFIIDTSGSMRSIWSKLMKEMDNILDLHPEVKGFQVMNDMGDYLVPSSAGGWLPDNPQSRALVLRQLSIWSANSNSSPVEGLEIALKTYAKPGVSLALYILGDEYRGGAYDPVIKTLNRLNTDKATGERIARVHAIGFVSGQPTDKFSTLMREVTRQNRGTFIALPR